MVLSLDSGSDIEAGLSPVVPRPAVPAVNWAASVPAPGQPGPHDLTITAFPDDGGAPASVTVSFVVQEPTPPPDSALTPQQSLELSVVNPGPPGPGDWASAIVKANRSDLDFTAVLDDAVFLARGDRYPVCSREWNQVTAPGEDYDRDTVGFSGWLLAPEISGADVPFTHPFGRDWECLVALDTAFAGLLAPGNVVFDPNDEELQQAAAEARDLGLLKTIQQVGGLMGVETDERCVPAVLHPPFGEVIRPGDRIAAIGRWIVDAAHTATVDPDQTPQLPEGGTSFRSEVHPPLLMAIGGTRVLTLTDIRTRIVLTSRPFLARQVYIVDTDQIGDDGAKDDGTLLQHLDHEMAKLGPDWWQLGIPDSVTIEAHPQIAAKPFDGIHVAAFTVRPPPDTADPAGPGFTQAQVSFQFTPPRRRRGPGDRHRPGRRWPAPGERRGADQPQQRRLPTRPATAPAGVRTVRRRARGRRDTGRRRAGRLTPQPGPRPGHEDQPGPGSAARHRHRHLRRPRSGPARPHPGPAVRRGHPDPGRDGDR